jgi:DNA-binding MarR family transcriptional regulator
VSGVDEVAAIQQGLEQLDRLRASRNGHAGLVAAAGVDLSRPAYALLRRIDEHGPATLGDLGRAAGMDAASTGRQVRRLEELGFVERTPDVADGRVITVTITPAGPTGTVVRGQVYIDSYNFFTNGGDELIDLPYAYTVG